MSLVCVAGAKGAPGVTLTALGVAAAWPTTDDQRKVLVEADPAGGSLALRHELGRQPGLITLTAAGRHDTLTRNDLWDHAQQLPGGLPVIVAPERADRARQLLDPAGPGLAAWLRGLPDVAAIADCGRLTPDPASAGICANADLVLIVARPTSELLHPAAAIARDLTEAGRRVAWVIVGDRSHAAAEIERVTGIPVARLLPDDPAGAAALAAGNVGRRFGRSALAHGIATLATDLAAAVTPTKVTAPEIETAEPRPLRSLAAAAAMAAGSTR